MIYDNEDDNKPSVVKCGSSRVNFPPALWLKSRLDGGGGGGGGVSSPPRSRLGLASDRHSRGSKIHARCQLNGKEAEMASRDWICAAAYRRLLISLFEALLHLLSCTFLWRDFGFQRGFLTVINPHSPFLSPVFPRFPFPAASLFPPFCSSDGSLSWFSLFGLFEPLCPGWS